MKKRLNKKGFTLIELIVVIAILGILAAIAVPRFAGIQNRAKVKSDYSNAAMIGNAAEAALAEGKITKTTTSADIKTALTTGNTYMASWPSPGFKAGEFVVKFSGDVIQVVCDPTDDADTEDVLYPAPSTIPDTY